MFDINKPQPFPIVKKIPMLFPAIVGHCEHNWPIFKGNLLPGGAIKCPKCDDDRPTHSKP